MQALRQVAPGMVPCVEQNCLRTSLPCTSNNNIVVPKVTYVVVLLQHTSLSVCNLCDPNYTCPMLMLPGVHTVFN